MPFAFLPKKVEATNILGYISGLSGVIKNLPMCQGISSIKTLFTQGSDQESAVTDDLVTTLKPTLTQAVADATDEADSVKVDVGDQVKSDTAASAAASKKLEKDTAILKTNDTCLQSIGRAVIKMLLQKITTDTVSWINGGMSGDPLFVKNPGEYFGDIAKNEMIGFFGEINDPTKFPFGKAFIQAEADSFKSKFANNAQYTLDKMIQDTNPGSNFTAQTFSQDFSQGGWAAWDAMTQNAANNPLGFTLMASNELAKRIEDKTQLAAGSLQQSGGYLGVQKCMDPEGVTKQEDEAGQKERASDPNRAEEDYDNRICNQWNFVTPGQMVAAAATKAINYPDNNLLSAQDLNDAVAAILDALLNSFSSSFMGENGFAGLSDTSEFQAGAQGDFVLNTDNTTDYNNPQVENDFSSYQIAASSFLSQRPNFNIRTDLNQALIDEQRIFSDKLIEENKELNSTIDKKNYNILGTFTPCASEGQTCSFPGTKIVSYGANGSYFLKTATNSTVCGVSSFGGDPIYGVPKTCSYSDSGASNAYGLIPTIYQLDYCIPGPHPGFEGTSRAALSAALGTVVPETMDSIKSKSASDIAGMVSSIAPLAAMAVGAVVGAAVGSVLPVIGNVVGAVAGAIVGVVLAYVSDLINSGKKTRIRAYYAGAIRMITGILVAVDKYDSSPSTLDWGPFSDAINKILDRYIQIIYDVYNPAQMPTVTTEAIQKYLEVKGYNQMFTNNEARITSMQSIIKRLGEIKNEIDKLNQSLSIGSITQTDYETALGPWISAFGRISQEMVTGDDIAVVDNTIKQIVDEKDYIYNNLLKGPNGCEKDLELAKGVDGPGLPWQVYATKRMEYPGQILYDYNNWNNTNKTTLSFPDPYNSGYKDNKMNVHTDINVIGPGFLSYVVFQSTNPSNCSSEGTPTDGSLHCPLKIDDVVPMRDWTTALGVNGNNSGDPSAPVSGIFEDMIGVY